MVSHSLAAFVTGTCLLWSPHRADLTSDNATHHSCLADEDCGHGDAFNCHAQLCKCRNDTLLFVAHATCLPGRKLGEDCQHDLQCRRHDSNASCLQNLCKCASGEANATHCAIPSDGQGSSGYKGLDPNMIPVVVVLPIMFIGMCVALQLFSKARFRNRRTIFNSPHPRLMHIKLGRKKRRSSHASLQMGSRRPSACSPHPSQPGSRMGSLHSLNGKKELGHTAPIALLDSSPSCEALDKKEAKQNGPDVLREAVVQNGPSSPMIIVNTVRRLSGSSSEGQSPTTNAATRV